MKRYVKAKPRAKQSGGMGGNNSRVDKLVKYEEKEVMKQKEGVIC